MNGEPAITDLEFRTVTDYLEVPVGTYDLAVNVAGTDTTVFSVEGVELAAADYTAVALGEVSVDCTDFTVALFEDTIEPTPAEDEARIRAIHASPDAPAVDVTVNDNALTVFENVAFGESSGYAIVPPDTYDVEIRPAGGGDVVYEAEVTFNGTCVYTAFAMGYLNPEDAAANEPFGLVPAVDGGGPSSRLPQPDSRLGRLLDRRSALENRPM